MYNQGIHYQIKEVIGADSDDEDDDAKRTIFCANLDQRVSEELLYEVFLQAGPIESVRIPKDNGGRQKTFGFVTYVHRCTVPYALSLLAGLSLFRKNLTIKEKYTPANNFPATDCEPLQRRSGGGGGGGSGRDNYDHRGGNHSNGGYNPFKGTEKTPPQRIEWCSNRRSDDLQKHPSHSKRPHQISPYSRSESSRDYGGGSGGGGSNHSNSNRRSSEKRNRHR